MPRQEEMAMRRISEIANMVKDLGIIDLDELNAWCLINQGISSLTVGRYVMALVKMNVLTYTPKTKLIQYVKKVEK